jgi:predicted DsbA family dithiol-disulfide isomerase
VTAAIAIDIWSDVACPWCYIGKRNLEAGLAAYRRSEESLPVEIEYHSFLRAPETPVEFEGNHVDYLVGRKGLPEDQVRAMDERVVGIALAAGLAYDFEALQPTNTVRAHQLLHLAKSRGRQGEMKERLLRAHFIEGRHIGRIHELAALAEEVGLDGDEVIRSLEEDEFLAEVDADVRQAREYGINGVPFFVIDGRYGLSGAHPPETFARALAQVTDERDQLPV